MPARDAKETIIRLDHDEKYAEIWTSDRAIRRKLERGRAQAAGEQRGQEWLRVPLKAFRWRIAADRPARKASPAQLAALAKRREECNAPK